MGATKNIEHMSLHCLLPLLIHTQFVLHSYIELVRCWKWIFHLPPRLKNLFDKEGSKTLIIRKYFGYFKSNEVLRWRSANYDASWCRQQNFFSIYKSIIPAPTQLLLRSQTNLCCFIMAEKAHLQLLLFTLRCYCTVTQFVCELFIFWETAFLLNFVIIMYNLIEQCNSCWKMTPLVSNKSCFYHNIFFATRTRVSALTSLCNNRVSASDTVSRLELELRPTSLLCCNLPCNRYVSVQTGLERESDDKQNKALARANGCSGYVSHQV